MAKEFCFVWIFPECYNYKTKYLVSTSAIHLLASDSSIFNLFSRCENLSCTNVNVNQSHGLVEWQMTLLKIKSNRELIDTINKRQLKYLGHSLSRDKIGCHKIDGKCYVGTWKTFFCGTHDLDAYHTKLPEQRYS